MRDRYHTDAALYPNVTEAASPPAEPFISSLARRFETLRSILADTNGDLVALSDRVLGPVPRGVGEASNGPNKPTGQAEDSLSALDLLISLAAGARDEAQRLNGRI